jgi:hypothetical protein
MRTVLLIVIMIFSIALKAQIPLSASDNMQEGTFRNGSLSVDSTPDKKWFLSKYSSISTGFSFFNGGNAMVVAAPMGLQLDRKLNNNFYAFAGISVAPAYINFNRSFLTADANKSYPNNSIFRSNSFGVYSRAELGLMYVNDARTFSISGSIGVQRSSSPLFLYQPVNAAKSNPVFSPNK